MFEIFNVNVNLLAIFLASLVNIVFGSLFFSKFLFGNLWLKLMGKRSVDLKMEATEILLSLVVALLISIGINSVLQYSLKLSGLDKISNIFATSFMITLTFVTSTLLNSIIYEGKRKKLFLLNVLHNFLTYLIMSFVLTLFI